MQQGKRSFVFFFLVSSPCLFLPRGLEPKSDATHLMMRCQSSCVPQATPPLATAVGAMAEQTTCTPCMGGDGMGQGRSRSPWPYKYRPSAEERRGVQKEKKRKERTAANGERNRKREKPTERERGTTETEKPKNRGYRQGNRERQSGRRKKKDRKDKTSGERGNDRYLYTTEAPLLSLGFTVTATATPPSTVTSTTVSSAIRDHHLR